MITYLVHEKLNAKIQHYIAYVSMFNKLSTLTSDSRNQYGSIPEMIQFFVVQLLWNWQQSHSRLNNNVVYIHVYTNESEKTI